MQADGAAADHEVHFPGVQDFQLHSSDGYTFHLSRQTLTQASGFFADMFALGSENSGPHPVTAFEEYAVLDPILRLAYARHGVSAPSISSFATLITLYRVAEKYEMHTVLQCLLSCLFLPRAIDGFSALPFVKTHPIPSLALLMHNGGQLGVQAAMQECILADEGAAVSEIDFTGIQIDARMVLYIHSERQRRIQAITSRIDIWPGCEKGCLRGSWLMILRKAVQKNPTLSALSKFLFESRRCPFCGRDVTTDNQSNINSLIVELRTLEQFPIPLPSVRDLPIAITCPFTDPAANQWYTP
jgi:hypothetical protein